MSAVVDLDTRRICRAVKQGHITVCGVPLAVTGYEQTNGIWRIEMWAEVSEEFFRRWLERPRLVKVGLFSGFGRFLVWCFAVSVIFRVVFSLLGLWLLGQSQWLHLG
jgi:hypothetical protein